MNDFNLPPEEFERRLTAAQAEAEQFQAFKAPAPLPQPSPECPGPSATSPNPVDDIQEDSTLSSGNPGRRFCLRALLSVPVGIFVWTAAVVYACHSLGKPRLGFPLFSLETGPGGNWIERALTGFVGSLNYAALLLGSLHGLVLAWGEAYCRNGKREESTTVEKMMLGFLAALLIVATIARFARVRSGL
jgi:hypothetical protein